MEYDDLHMRMRQEFSNDNRPSSPPSHPDLPPGLGPNTVVVMPEDADEHPPISSTHLHSDLSPRYSNSDEPYPNQSPYSASESPVRQQQPVFANQSPSPRQYYDQSPSPRSRGGYSGQVPSPRQAYGAQTPSPRQQYTPSPRHQPTFPVPTSPVRGSFPVPTSSSQPPRGVTVVEPTEPQEHYNQDAPMEYEQERALDSRESSDIGNTNQE